MHAEYRNQLLFRFVSALWKQGSPGSHHLVIDGAGCFKISAGMVIGHPSKCPEGPGLQKGHGQQKYYIMTCFYPCNGPMNAQAEISSQFSSGLNSIDLI